MLSQTHQGVLDSSNIYSICAPFCPWFFKGEDMALSIIALSSLNNACANPSPLKAAILYIRLIPLICEISILIHESRYYNTHLIIV